MTSSDHDTPASDLTLSERVANANTWEGAVRAHDGGLLLELNVYPVETSSALPSASFNTGPIGLLKRFIQGRPVQSDRTVPRRRA